MSQSKACYFSASIKSWLVQNGITFCIDHNFVYRVNSKKISAGPFGPVPCKCKQFWIRFRANTPQKTESVPNGSDPVRIRSRVNGVLPSSKFALVQHQARHNRVQYRGYRLQQGLQVRKRLLTFRGSKANNRQRKTYP